MGNLLSALQKGTMLRLREYPSVGNGQKYFTFKKIYGCMRTRNSRNPEDFIAYAWSAT